MIMKHQAIEKNKLPATIKLKAEDHVELKYYHFSFCYITKMKLFDKISKFIRELS